MANAILTIPYDQLVSLAPPAFERFILDAKGAAKEKSEKAKLHGTAAHDWIEKYISAVIEYSDLLPETPESKEAVNATIAFHAWTRVAQDRSGSRPKEILSSDKYKIAGKLDAIAIVDGVPSIVDFKTSSQLSASYILQCAGYDLMLSEMGFAVRQYIILRVPKDGTAAETLTISDRDEMEFARETFLHQREAHKFYVYAENKLKENGKMRVDLPSIETEKPAKGATRSKSQTQK